MPCAYTDARTPLPRRIIKDVRERFNRLQKCQRATGSPANMRPPSVGAGRGIGSANVVSAALRPPPLMFFKHGDSRGERIKSMARWPDPMSSEATHFNRRLELDVIVVSERRNFTKDDCRQHFSLDSETWTPQALIGCGWRLVARNTIIVHEIDDDFHIIAMFLNEIQSPELRSALEYAEAAAGGMFRYLRLLPRLKAKGDVISAGLHRGRNHLSFGNMVMEGAYVGIYGSTKGAHYYARCEDADRDADFLRAEALHFTGLQAMERLHVPCYYANRMAFSERVGFPGMIPAVPLENLACISASCTKGYACDAHSDSAVRGAAESVYWHKPQAFKMPKGHIWCFAICDACVLFDLGVASSCVCYLPGRGVVHGTLPTSAEHYEHSGNGFALVTKARSVGPRGKEHFASMRS